MYGVLVKGCPQLDASENEFQRVEVSEEDRAGGDGNAVTRTAMHASSAPARLIEDIGCMVPHLRFYAIVWITPQ
jgi:hypothetical protein